MAKKSFDLGEYLRESGAVSNSDTDREQIEYIDIDKLQQDSRNFYSLDGIDELSANIMLFGLQQPLRVRLETNGMYAIVSGHRRYAAIGALHAEDAAVFAQVPCIVEREDGGSPALQELRLIFANSDTRRMTSADISRQAERVEALLYQLKCEGYDFPGKMRAHVAEACKVSESKLARLRVIREGLAPCWKRSYRDGDLSEDTAYTLARADRQTQNLIYDGLCVRGDKPTYFYKGAAERYIAKLESIKAEPCAHDNEHSLCRHIGELRKHIAFAPDGYSSVTPCAKCCAKCDNLSKCRDACPSLRSKIDKLKAAKKAENQAEKDRQEAHDRLLLDRTAELWRRFGEARKRLCITVQQTMAATEMMYGKDCEDDYKKREAGDVKLYEKLPYGYGMSLGDVKHLCAVADLLGVSIDYLLCRTDNPEVNS